MGSVQTRCTSLSCTLWLQQTPSFVLLACRARGSGQSTALRLLPSPRHSRASAAANPAAAAPPASAAAPPTRAVEAQHRAVKPNRASLPAAAVQPAPRLMKVSHLSGLTAAAAHALMLHPSWTRPAAAAGSAASAAPLVLAPAAQELGLKRCTSTALAAAHARVTALKHRARLPCTVLGKAVKTSSPSQSAGRHCMMAAPAAGPSWRSKPARTPVSCTAMLASGQGR